MFFSGIQEGATQLSSMMASQETCCAAKNLEDSTEECELDKANTTADSCCEGATCDCTCCIHISLFNTSFSTLIFQGENAKDFHSYADINGYNVPFPIFHPPLFLI